MAMSKKKIANKKTKTSRKTKNTANKKASAVAKKVKATKKVVSKAVVLKPVLKKRKTILSKQINKKGSVVIAKVNEIVPDFSLPSTEGADFQLAKFKGKKIVLYFYPKDSTPGCTTEGLQFSQLTAEFEKLNTVVFGISRDSLGSHDKFRCKQNFKFHLLSDSEEVACKIFDVIKEKNMYGKMVLGIERSTFLISDKGILVKEWRKVKADGHAAEVLQAIKDLK